MYDFVIVEDDLFTLDYIKRVVIYYSKIKKITFNIIACTNISDKFIKYIKNHYTKTIYLIDIDLPKTNGIELIKYIRRNINDWKSPILICSSYSAHIYELYTKKYQIFDFLIKDYNLKEALFKDIDLCLDVLKCSEKMFLYYKKKEYAIEYNLINFIKKEGRKICIVTENNVYYINKNLCSIKEKLPSCFIHSTKGVYINMRNVIEINWKDNFVLFKDGSFEHVISRSHKKELIDYFKDKNI